MHVSNDDLCSWFRRHVVQPITMAFVDRTQASDLATPAKPVLHFLPLFFSSRSDPGNLYPRPMLRATRRVDAGVLCPLHHGGESSYLHETSCSNIFDCLPGSRFPDSAFAFNKSIHADCALSVLLTLGLLHHTAHFTAMNLAT